MKIWCKHCDDFPEGLCAYCGGDGYTNPPQQILDDLECAEIERKIIKENLIIIYHENENGVCELSLKFDYSSMNFTDTSKLAVYRKAKEWIEGRG